MALTFPAMRTGETLSHHLWDEFSKGLREMKSAFEPKDEAPWLKPPVEPDPADDPGDDSPGMNPDSDSDPFGY